MSRRNTVTEAEADYFNPEFPPYLTIDDALKAAPFLTRGVLAGMRYAKTGPEFVKPSRKTVGYPNAAFFKWLHDTTVYTAARPRDTRPSTRRRAK